MSAITSPASGSRARTAPKPSARLRAAQPPGGAGGAAGLEERRLGHAEGGGGVAHPGRSAGAQPRLAGEEVLGKGVVKGLGHPAERSLPAGEIKAGKLGPGASRLRTSLTRPCS